MKTLLLIFVLAVSISSGMGQTNRVNSVSEDERIETVDFCDLINSPDVYDGKLVRTNAIYGFGGEDFKVLFCPQCYKNGTLHPYFTDSFRYKTKRATANKLSRERHPSGTVKVTVVGTFHAHRLEIDYVESAKYLSTAFAFPEGSPTKTKGKVACKRKE